MCLYSMPLLLPSMAPDPRNRSCLLSLSYFFSFSFCLCLCASTFSIIRLFLLHQLSSPPLTILLLQTCTLSVPFCLFQCLNNSSQKTEKQNHKNFGTKTFRDCIPVKMRLALECNKELRSICVRTTISHRKNARSIMC